MEGIATPLRLLLIVGSDRDPEIWLGDLRRAGFEPSWERVASAAALAAALAHEWDVALCDWHLPGLAGPDAVAMIRLRQVDLPIIIVSSDARQSAAVDALKAGADDFVVPQVTAQLAPVVERALREADMRRVRRRAEEALRESGERFAQAFAHAPIGMAIVGLDGITLHVNRACCAMFGRSEAEMAGMPVWRLTHPDDLPATFQQLQRLVEGESDAWHMEKRYLHSDGHIVWARSSTWLVRGPDGDARYVVSQLQDITAQRRLEEQMRRQQSELAHVLRVATMGEMVAEIAHEINQPLASIANFANGLAARLAGQPNDVEAMRGVAMRIASEAMRASDVIRRLRGFLRKGESKREHCTANEIVRDAVRLMEPELRQHTVAVSLELTTHPDVVDVDRVQVEQVVLNLLRNAIEAIAAASNGRRSLVVQTAVEANDTIVVSIRDSGIGLPDSAGTKIFEAFFTTKENGLGLGLTIGRSIIEAHDGKLWAQANPNGGATVAFTLPVVTPRA